MKTNDFFRQDFYSDYGDPWLRYRVDVCQEGGLIVGQYDNFNNSKNIEKAQKKLDKLTRKRNPNQFDIELAQRELDTAKLFETCQRFVLPTYDYGEMHFLFNDDDKVTLFGGKLISYADIESYTIVANNVTVAHTTTKSKGTISRALVGGALAGGVGAVVGAMSAGSKSNTTYNQSTEGFFFQICLKNGESYQCHFRGAGLFSDKIPKEWLRLSDKIKIILGMFSD